MGEGDEFPKMTGIHTRPGHKKTAGQFSGFLHRVRAEVRKEQTGEN